MKILLISHNSLSTHQNMGKTLLSLLSAVSPLELCQLYIYPQIPDTDKASSYYRITDKDVLRSYYKFHVCGKVVEPDLNQHSSYENPNDEAFYRNRANRKASRKILRDLMWKFSRWYNKELEAWIEKEKPTCIFLAPGNAKFIYDVALKISKTHNLPIVTYICDDYYFVKKPKELLAKLNRHSLRKKIKKTMIKSQHVITICDELNEAYSKEFSVPATTVMTGAGFPIAEKPRDIKEPKSISYFGNVRCNRFYSLAEIGNALDKINSERNTDYELCIYTSEKDTDILSHFDGIKSIKLCGFVTGDEFKKAFQASDILLHTEAFDEKSIDLVKHSVSTKIADSLSSGIPFFAYGPENVASIRYLLKNDSAITATSKHELYDKLILAFDNENVRKEKIINALACARSYHDADSVSQNVRKLFEEI